MGKGDKRTKKGKIFKGSNGNSRPTEATKVKKVLTITGTKKA